VEKGILPLEKQTAYITLLVCDGSAIDTLVGNNQYFLLHTRCMRACGEVCYFFWYFFIADHLGNKVILSVITGVQR